MAHLVVGGEELSYFKDEGACGEALE